MRRLLIWTALLSLTAGAGVVGCSGGGSSGSSGGSSGGAAPATGALRVLVTDAPLSDLTSVTLAAITVERLELHASNGLVSSGTAATSSGTASVTSGGNGNGKGNGNRGGRSGVASTGSGVAPTASGTAGWHVVYDAAGGGGKTFNLLDLRGGINAELAVAQLPVAKYTQMRIVISAAEIVHDGNTYSTANGLLEITSGKTAGLQIAFQNDAGVLVQAGGTAELLLDVDLSKSFSYTGSAQSPNDFKLGPQIRLADLATSGSLAGVVRSDNGTPNDTADDTPLANAAVSASYNGVTVNSFTDAQGVYVLPGLDAGDWDLAIQAAGHDAYAAAGITVSAGQQTTSDATLVKQ
jgi:hypothetical protein